MQYRKFGKADATVSALGFGMMRLPVLPGGKSADIDVDKTRKMLEYAVGKGVNYIDTAYSYHGGASETVTGRILSERGLRDKVYLATKSPTWLVDSRPSFDRYLGEQLQKLRTDHIDMYLMHALNHNRWDVLVDADVFEFMDKAKEDGRIRFAGFSFHDDIETFKRIIDSYAWDFCQIQFNFMDEDFQAGLEGLQYAGDRGIPVVVMEPLRGGSLVTRVHEDILGIYDRAEVKRTPAEWALRWVWNHPQVALALSGMGEMGQVEENIGTAEDAYPLSLTEEELAMFEEVKNAYRSKIKVACTACQYCMPCPMGIKIPDCFAAYNTASMYGALDGLAREFSSMGERFGDPSACADCGACEAACPQNLPIREHLREIVALVDRKK